MHSGDAVKILSPAQEQNYIRKQVCDILTYPTVARVFQQCTRIYPTTWGVSTWQSLVSEPQRLYYHASTLPNVVVPRFAFEHRSQDYR